MSTDKKPENQAATAPPGNGLGTSPGRSADAELIRLAAERVMGWTYRPRPSERKFEMWEFERPDACNIFASPHKLTGERDWWPLTSDSDAMMLWDKMRADGWCWELSQSNADAIGCQDEIYRYHSLHIEHTYDRCRPRAITIAALRAVGVDTDKIEAAPEMSRGDTDPTPSAEGSQGGSR